MRRLAFLALLCLSGALVFAPAAAAQMSTAEAEAECPGNQTPIIDGDTGELVECLPPEFRCEGLPPADVEECLAEVSANATSSATGSATASATPTASATVLPDTGGGPVPSLAIFALALILGGVLSSLSVSRRRS